MEWNRTEGAQSSRRMQEQAPQELPIAAALSEGAPSEDCPEVAPQRAPEQPAPRPRRKSVPGVLPSVAAPRGIRGLLSRSRQENSTQPAPPKKADDPSQYCRGLYSNKKHNLAALRQRRFSAVMKVAHSLGCPGADGGWAGDDVYAELSQEKQLRGID